MIARFHRAGAVTMALSVLAWALTACAGPGSPTSTASSTSTGSAAGLPGGGTSSAPAPSGGGSPSSPAPTDDAGQGADGRFIIDCTGVDGSSSQFATLADAWSSPNYVRIASCVADTANDGVLLTADEQRIAAIVGESGDAMSAYLQVLAACVRISPELIPQQPEGLLRAVLTLCPDTPEAGLISSALKSEEAG